MKASIGHHVVVGAGHRLTPLLTPRSIALVGASPRSGSIGNETARALLDSGFVGPIAFVNRRHEEIEGQRCVGDLSELDVPPDLAILNVGAARLEATLEGAVRAGAKSAVVFDICQGMAAGGMPLLDRLKDIAREADLPVCGGNGMGFYNVPDRCHASFYAAHDLKPGGITLIAHSGSVFTVLALNDPRYRFDLVISSGQEIGATLDEYVDFAVSRPQTRVIALFMEAARNPQGFARALEKAHEHGVPVVVCKVGRTRESASLAQSHSGAMAGNDIAYDALFERYGALRVETVDQLMNVSMLLSQGREMSRGEVAAVTDSGGLRELFIDRAKSCAVPLAELSDDTVAHMARMLPPGLPPSNPLDCAGAWSDAFDTVFENGLKVLSAAPEVGLLGYEVDIRDDYVYIPAMLELAQRLPQITDKPCFVYSSFSQANNRAVSDGLADAGVPLINGLDETLAAVSALRTRRDLAAHLSVVDPLPPAPDPEVIEKWFAVLKTGSWVGEAAGLAMLAEFGIPAAACTQCKNLPEVLAAANRLGYPVVLKTAQQGIAHKSDAGGVVPNIQTLDALEAAYREMAQRQGPHVLVQEMASGGVELAFGFIQDRDFGPIVMVSAGGTLIELIGDSRFALAPFGPGQAARLVSQLKAYPLLSGHRGARPCDLQSLAAALSGFSVMCAALCDTMCEADVNPVLVSDQGVVAVDALITPGGPLPG